ncbi:MAG: ankyrin repeat domain-containing protein [Sulfurovaceae bacterium]
MKNYDWGNMANRKKLFLILGIVFLLLIIFGFYKQYSFNKPDILFESHLTKAGVTEEFKLSTKQKGYIIGLAVNEKSFSWWKIVDGKYIAVDGNYTIEYYKDNKLDKKEIINRMSLSKLYGNLYHISGSSSLSSWKQITLGELKKAGDYKIKITVIRPESSLSDFKGTLYFFADKSNEKLMQKMNSYNTPEKKAANKRERLLKNLIDVNETNQLLIPLREALDMHDFEKIKEIINADNNISINKDMVFQRRALDYAAFENDIKTVQYLIDNGADIHHKDELGKNALAYAIENNATKTAKLLIDSGIDVKEVEFVQNYLQHRLKGKYLPKTTVMSPLQYTAGNALFEMTELLLKHGMKDNIIEWQAHNINIYTYLYYRTTMNTTEKTRMLKLLNEYKIEVENLNKQK